MTILNICLEVFQDFGIDTPISSQPEKDISQGIITTDNTEIGALVADTIVVHPKSHKKQCVNRTLSPVLTAFLEELKPVNIEGGGHEQTFFRWRKGTGNGNGGRQGI